MIVPSQCVQAKWSRAEPARKLCRVGMAGLVLGLCLVPMGCDGGLGGRRQRPTETVRPTTEQQARLDAIERSARSRASVMEGTIGSVAYIDPVPNLTVEGFGIVNGLEGRGSAECPPDIRDALIEQMRKNTELRDVRTGRMIINPSEFIASKDTAVVRVIGVIPAGAVKGDRFDLRVITPPMSQTESLEGGVLYTCSLSVRRDGAGTRGLASGAGPVYIERHARPESGTGGSSGQEGEAARAGGDGGASPGASDGLIEPPAGSLFRGGQRHLREGRVLGGGVVTEDRPVRLVLMTPSYNMANRVRRVINMRFPSSGEAVADAVSPSYINLRIPPQWQSRRDQFLAIITHLHLREDPSYLETQARELVRAIQQNDAPYADVSLVWEAMGRPVLPLVRLLYDAPSPQASFYAARTGARIGDSLALEALGRHAHDRFGTQRDLAIAELGNVDDFLRSKAADILAPLVRDADQRIRVKAYEALVRLNVPTTTMASMWIPGGNFHLDVIDLGAGGQPIPPAGQPGGPFIYAYRYGQQRLAIFGSHLEVGLPLFFVTEDERITLLSDSEQAGRLQVIRRTVDGAASRRGVPPNVGLLVRFLGTRPMAPREMEPGTPFELTGMLVAYSQVIGMLQELSAAGHIAAPVVMQTISTQDQEGMRLAPRPHSDSDPGAITD